GGGGGGGGGAVGGGVGGGGGGGAAHAARRHDQVFLPRAVGPVDERPDPGQPALGGVGARLHQGRRRPVAEQGPHASVVGAQELAVRLRGQQQDGPRLPRLHEPFREAEA